jgi:hypothetical protein
MSQKTAIVTGNVELSLVTASWAKCEDKCSFKPHVAAYSTTRGTLYRECTSDDCVTVWQWSTSVHHANNTKLCHWTHSPQSLLPFPFSPSISITFTSALHVINEAFGQFPTVPPGKYQESISISSLFPSKSLPDHHSSIILPSNTTKFSYWLYRAEHYSRVCQLCSHSRTFQHFIEPEGSLLQSLSQTNPIHTTPFQLSKINLNIIHPPTSWSTQRSLSLWLSYQQPTYVPLLPHSCYMSSPSHSPWLDHSNHTWGRLQMTKLLIMQFSPPSHNFSPFRSKYSPQHPVLKYLQSIFLP